MKVSGFWLKGLAVVMAGILFAGCQSAPPRQQFKFDPLTQAPMEPPPPPPASTANAAPAPAPVDPTTAPILHVGDRVTVSFQDLVTPIPAVDATVKDDGTITLIYNKQFQADGRTLRQLENDIREAYVPGYFRNMTPSVTIMDRFFFVGGEVKAPGRQVYTGRILVLGAIDAAGGFTDYANRKKVVVTHALNSKQETVDAKRALDHPELNVEIFPGDSVFVKKRLW